MARAAIVVGAGLVLATVGWLLWSPGEGLPETRGVAEVANHPAGDPAAATPVAAPVAAAVEAGERTSAPEETAVAPPVPADAIWLDVLVVDQATQQPVAGAEAVWSDETQMALGKKLPPEERPDFYRDRERISRQHGWHGRSDREGKLHVNLGKQGTRVFASAGTRYGEASFNRGQQRPPEGWCLLLAEDQTLRVHVLDAANRPAAGVPLAIEPFNGDLTHRHHWGGEIRTDAEGIVAFAHVQALRARWAEGRARPAAQCVLRLLIPEIGIAPMLVDLQPPPAEAVEIRLPPTGRLKVRVTYEGRKPPGLGELTVNAGPKGQAEAHNSAWPSRTDAEGWARFPYVPLGKTWFVGTRTAGGSWDFEMPGPTLQGQEAAASFEIADQVVSLTGRLLDVDGRPLQRQEVIASVDSSFMTGGWPLQTEADGHFVLILGRHVPEERRELHLRRLSFERRPDGASPLRVVAAARDLVPGRNDLGDLRLDVDALVVSGRLAFDVPGPRDNWLQIQRGVESQGRPGPAMRWNGVDGLQISMQDDGRFEVRGAVEPARYRIAIPTNNCLPVDPVEFAVGATDVVIAIRRGSALTVKCRLPDGIVAQRVRLRLQPVGAALAVKAARRDPLRMNDDPLVGGNWGEMDGESAKYYWPALESGTYTLSVEGQGFAEPFATVSDVVVPQPEGGDPRLRDFDLGPWIDVLRVRLQNGGPGNGRAVVFPQPQPEDRDWSGSGLYKGEAVLPVPKRPVDLLVACEGMRPATVRGATGSVEVTLEPWPSLELHFPGAEGLPAAASLRAALNAPAPAGRRAARYRTEEGSGSLDSLLGATQASAVVRDGVATLPVGEGARRLSVFVQLGDRGRPKALEQVVPKEVVAGAPVTVQLSPEELRAAVESLQSAAGKK